jgi:hypothetical protein
MGSALQVFRNELVRKIFGSSKGKMEKRSVCLAAQAPLISEATQGAVIKIAIGGSQLQFRI